MVSQQFIKDYAEKIYRNIEGYSFEKVIRLFPRYYIQIKYYYDILRSEEAFASFKIMTVLFKGRIRSLNELVRDELDAYHLFFREQTFMEQEGAPEEYLDRTELDFLRAQNELYIKNSYDYKEWLEQSAYYGIYDYVKPKVERQLTMLKQEYQHNKRMIYQLHQKLYSKGEY